MINVKLYSVSDDSGFLALVDPDAYTGFVGANGEFAVLMRRFQEQMAAGTLLIWGTGSEELWKVEVQPWADSARSTQGFRQCTGMITSSSGRLLLTNYESLTMAAQFPHVRLPERHDTHLVISVQPGQCRCRVTQLRDPDESPPAEGSVDFTIELEASTASTAREPAWSVIPWFTLD